MALSVGDRLGPYEILAPVGKGGMGEVHNSRDQVSVEQFGERFEREAKAMVALNPARKCCVLCEGW
jgi:hypothetical protein